MDIPERLIAFHGTELIASGTPGEVAEKCRLLLDEHPQAQILVFDAETSRAADLDLRGSVDDVLARLVPPPPPQRGPGRPKLGVVPREVTLLPRHWEWLGRQPGGASVTLRKLVEAASKSGQGRERIREAQDAAYRFMLAVAGDLPGFEEATRALYRDDRETFESITEPWPQDVRDHSRKLAAESFSGDVA